jgi:hypothetical protein
VRSGCGMRSGWPRACCDGGDVAGVRRFTWSVRRPDGRRARSPGLRERQLAEHARYRIVVETTIKASAARDEWNQGAAELHTEWETLRERYPAPEHQEASPQPDGSWVGGGRRLSPEQNAEADKYGADLREEAAEGIRPAMERVAAADPERKLAGLEHMLKGADRLKEKIADVWEALPGLTIRQAASSVPDPVRFTLCYPAERYAEGVAADVERVKSEGFELIKLKNSWHSDQYKGINSQWRVPDTETRLDVQFHTPESWEAKELTHQAYERIRAEEALPAVRRDPVAEQELKDFQHRANSLLRTPPGASAIDNFP